MLNYSVHASSGSLFNTPNTFGIFVLERVFNWLEENGGISEMRKKNVAKAKVLYDAIDSSDGYYRGHAERSSRSLMNVTFNLPNESLEKQFSSQAKENDMDGLKGHRSVGGIRASIYNAFPLAGVEALVDFMNDFRSENG